MLAGDCDVWRADDSVVREELEDVLVRGADDVFLRPRDEESSFFIPASLWVADNLRKSMWGPLGSADDWLFLLPLLSLRELWLSSSDDDDDEEEDEEEESARGLVSVFSEDFTGFLALQYGDSWNIIELIFTQLLTVYCISYLGFKY